MPSCGHQVQSPMARNGVETACSDLGRSVAPDLGPRPVRPPCRLGVPIAQVSIALPPGAQSRPRPAHPLYGLKNMQVREWAGNRAGGGMDSLPSG